MGLVLRRMPAPTADEYAGMIAAALEHQLSRGITSTNDAGVAPELLDTYRRLDAEHRLPARVNVMALRLVDGVGTVPLPPRRHATDRLRIDTVKFFADGGLSGATAALSVPYRHADTRGVLRMDEREFLALAHEAHDAGWRIATHAIGDVAIDQVLRVYAALGTAPMRHRIEHFGLPTEDQLAHAARGPSSFLALALLNSVSTSAMKPRLASVSTFNETVIASRSTSSSLAFSN